MHTLTDLDFHNAAVATGLTPRIIRTVAAVESNGKMFEDGRPVVRFEPHWFQRLTKGRFNKSHPRLSHSYGMRFNWSQPGSQARRYSEQIEPAMALDRDATIQACSWGGFQVMGFNFHKCGFKNPQEFLNAHWTSAGGQLLAAMAFIKSAGLIDELQRLDWAGFAYGYNGPDFASNQYDKKLAAAYARLG